MELKLDEILTELERPLWWFSAVLVAILINVASSYIKSGLDKGFLRGSAWWRGKSEKRQKAWDERIRFIQSSKEARDSEIRSEFRLILRSIRALLMAIFITVSPVIFSGEMTRTGTIFIFSVAAWFWFTSSKLYYEAVVTSLAVAFSDAATEIDDGDYDDSRFQTKLKNLW